MINFAYIAINKYATQGQNKFVFSKGLHYLRGRNLDAPWNTKGNSNGAGKSTLFKPLIPLIFGTKKRRRGQYELGIMGKGKHRIRWDLETNTVNVSTNDKSEIFRTKADARERLGELLPWNYEQFTSCVYLNSLATNTILSGTPNERHKLFESIFDLSLVDTLGEKIKQLLDALNVKQGVVQSLREQLPDVPSIDLVKARAWLAQTEKRQAQYEKETEDANQAVAIMRAWEAFDPEYADVDLKQELDTLRFKIKLIRGLRDRHIEWTKQNEAYKNYLQQAKKAKAIKAELVLLPQIETKQSFALLQQELQTAINAKKSWQNARSELKVITAMPGMKGVEMTHAGIVGFDKEGSSADKALRQLSKATHNCPCCGAKLTDQHRANHIRQLKSLHARWESVKDVLEDAARALRDVETYKGKVLNDTQHAALVAKLERAKKQEAGSRRAIELKAELAFCKLAKVDDPGKEPPKANLETLAKLTEEFHHVKALQQVKETLTVPTKAIRQLAARQPELVDRMHKLGELIRSRSEIIQRTEYEKRQADKLNAEIVKHERALNDYLPLQALRQVLGPKGVRVSAITSLIRLYEANLNRFGKEVFGDKYSFTCQARNRNLDIQYTVGSTSEDISELSGYESRAFVILHLLALLPLIPPNLRCNVVIFDEIESCLSPENKIRFAEQIIPKLQQVVPCIVLITPTMPGEFSTPGAYEWMMERKNNVSTLTKVGG